MKDVILAVVLFVLGVNLSVSQDLTNDSLTAEERHRLGGKNVAITAKYFEARTYVNGRKDTLLYRLLKPINYDPSKKHPLVVCLSGNGGRGDDNIKQIAGCWPAQIMSKTENKKRYEAFVFVPQCPSGANWSGSLVSSLVFEVIHKLENEFEIDTTRRYVTGQSMGGYGSWYFILTHPQMFAAAIPICGGGNPDLATKIVDVPIWAFHGQKDNAVPVESSRKMIDAIKKAGGNPRYNEFPDAGHVCWPQAYDTPGLLDWLFAQKND